MFILQKNKYLLLLIALSSGCSIYTQDPVPAQAPAAPTPAPQSGQTSSQDSNHQVNFLTNSPSASAEEPSASIKKPSISVKEPSAPAEQLSTNPLTSNRLKDNKPGLPTSTTDLWRKIGTGASFSTTIDHARVDKFITWYQRNPSYFEPIFKRALLYLGHVTARLEHHRMPMELALLPFVESAYNPFAHSRSGAAGLWQFIPSTGDHMGLARNWWYDERRDVELSTEAAIKYLSYLNRRFQGDWLLTLAAYNGGEGTISRAMRRNIREGKPTDFWNLDLSRETESYVPQLIALAQICANPQRYGLHFPPIPDTPVFTSVELPGPIVLKKAAEMAGIDYALASKLNPALRRGITPREGPHRIMLPVDATDSFKQGLASTPKHLWQPAQQYTVRAGDTLGEIALKNHVPLAALKQENRLLSNNIRVGRVLKIPGTGISDIAPLYGEIKQLVYYRVRKGDSLSTIAHKFETKNRSLMQLNNLNHQSILQPGQRLKVYPGMARQKANEIQYRVKRGDSLYTIAHLHRISIVDILRWYKIKSSDLLQPGQLLRLLIRS